MIQSCPEPRFMLFSAGRMCLWTLSLLREGVTSGCEAGEAGRRGTRVSWARASCLQSHPADEVGAGQMRLTYTTQCGGEHAVTPFIPSQGTVPFLDPGLV